MNQRLVTRDGVGFIWSSECATVTVDLSCTLSVLKANLLGSYQVLSTLKAALNIRSSHFLASSSEERDFGCPSPWIRGGRKCYLFNSNMSVVFQDARDFCSRNKGRLLQVSSMDEKVCHRDGDGFKMNTTTVNAFQSSSSQCSKLNYKPQNML